MRAAASAAAILCIVAAAPRALADDAVKVVVAGPKKDPITARLEKELTALGFAPIVVGSLDHCAQKSVALAVEANAARAGLCSDGTVVGVWTDDGSALKLRDVVAPQEKGPHVHDQVAMRAAEVARANIAFREASPLPPEPAKPPPPLMSGESWDEFEQQDRPPPPVPPKMVNRFRTSVGVGVVAGVHSTQNAVSGELGYGIHRAFALTLRAEISAGDANNTLQPVSSPKDQSDIRFRTGIAGLGIQVPLTKASDRFVPRLGASFGVAWLHATKDAGIVVDDAGRTSGTSAPASDTIFVPAAWVTAGLSIGLFGPLRIVADGLIGSGLGALTAREQGIALAEFGSPIFGAAGRLEWAIP